MSVADKTADIFSLDESISRCVELGGVIATPQDPQSLQFYAEMSSVGAPKFYLGLRDDYDDLSRVTYLNGQYSIKLQDYLKNTPQCPIGLNILAYVDFSIMRLL